jgi:hypothetical protein
MTLMDAEQPDLKRERRRTILIISGIVLILFLAWLGYHERNYGQRHAADKFFAAIQNKQYEQAYAIWKNPQYAYNDFYTDWGPGGEWGLVKDYSVDCSLNTGSGVIVQVTVNGRSEHPYLWVKKEDNSLSFSPSEIQCGNWFAWLLE